MRFYSVGVARRPIPDIVAWAEGSFPRGAGRRFGTSRAIDGVIVQERGEDDRARGRYDVTVTTQRTTRELTLWFEWSGERYRAVRETRDSIARRSGGLPTEG